MAENRYDNEMRFVIFPNANKEEGSSQPDYTGEVTIEGKTLRLAGWRSTSKSGVAYVSGKVSEFQERAAGASGTNTTAPPADRATRDEIPF